MEGSFSTCASDVSYVLGLGSGVIFWDIMMPSFEQRGASLCAGVPVRVAGSSAGEVCRTGKEWRRRASKRPFGVDGTWGLGARDGSGAPSGGGRTERA